MASIISAGTTSGTSLNLSGDTSGVLQLASNGSTTAVTIDTSQNVIVNGTSALNSAANRGNITIRGSSSRIINFGNASAETGYIVSDSSGLEIRNVENLPMIFATNNAERMRIDSGGRVTMSAQPCFLAYSYSNNTQDVAKSFDTIPINVGSCYNNANGRFTAPVAGIYEFRASYIGVQAADTVTRLKFFKNDVIVLNGDASVGRLDGTATGSELPFGEVTVFLNLAASDYITNVVSTDSGASLTNLGWGKFCGRLMQ